MSTKKFLTSLVATSALLATSGAFASPFKVNAEVSSAKAERATPSFIVESGESASLAATGETGYKLTFTVTDAGPGNVKVAAELATPSGELAPTLVVPLGKPVAVSVGEVQLKFTVEPVEG